MTPISVLTINIAKQTFHVVGIDDTSTIVLRKRIPRDALMPFIAQLSPFVIGMEACGGLIIARGRFHEYGHTVKLIAPEFVKP
jgi:transposase